MFFRRGKAYHRYGFQETAMPLLWILGPTDSRQKGRRSILKMSFSLKLIYSKKHSDTCMSIYN